MNPLSPLSTLTALQPLPDGEAGGIVARGEFAVLLDQMARFSATAEMEMPEASASAGPDGLALDTEPVEAGSTLAPKLPSSRRLPEGGKALPLQLPAAATPARAQNRADLPKAETPDEPLEPDQTESTPDSGQSPSAPTIPDLIVARVVVPPASVVPAMPSAPDLVPGIVPGQTRTRVDQAPPKLVPPLLPPPQDQASPAPVRTGPAITSALAINAAAAPASVARPARRTASRPELGGADPAPVALAVPARQLVAATRRIEDPSPRPTASIEQTMPPSPAEPTQASVPALPEVRAPRPHDFGALIDRLLAAREASQPQAVSLALPHAEFGRVALRFHHDEGGLSVSLASPDPDFARAAAQALPPIQSIVASDATGQHGATTQSDRQQGFADLSGQPRQPARDQRSDRTDQRQQEQNTGHRAPATDHRRRGGIFA